MAESGVTIDARRMAPAKLHAYLTRTLGEGSFALEVKFCVLVVFSFLLFLLFLLLSSPKHTLTNVLGLDEERCILHQDE